MFIFKFFKIAIATERFFGLTWHQDYGLSLWLFNYRQLRLLNNRVSDWEKLGLRLEADWRDKFRGFI